MKEKQRSSITMVLLVVGVLFILVAGGIFVTTAWQYLPELGKQLMLLGVSLGAFAGSYGMSKNEKLDRAARAVFYLGIAFLGFFVITILGGVSGDSLQENMLKILIANLLMLLPVGIKLMAQKHAFEFAMLTVLVDSILVTGCVTFDADLNTYFITQAVYVMVLAIADSKIQKMQLREDALSLCIGIVYLIHICFFAMVSFGYFLVDDALALSIGFPGVIAVATAFSWNARQEIALRVINSLAILWFGFVTVYKILDVVAAELPADVMWLVVISVHLFVMLLLKRKEIMLVQVVTAMIVPYIQMFCYWIEAWDLFGGLDEQWNTTYYPYSVLYAMAFLAWHILQNGTEGIFAEWQEEKNLKFAALQMLNAVLVGTVSKASQMMGMVFFLLGAVVMMTIACYLEQVTAKKVFKTLAMFSGIVAIFCQPFLAIPTEYIVEWGCFLIAIGIVLFRFVWYDKKEQFSNLYFITTCLMLSGLLLYNLIVEGIGNVLILGLTGVVMLVIAAILNNRKYVVAASVTLIVLVLYLTKAFWLSIAWWVYLFAAGVILVLLAIKKEKDA